MAIKKTIEIDIETGDAVKDVNKLTDSVKDLEKQTEDIGSKSFKGVGDNAKKAGKGVKGLGAKIFECNFHLFPLIKLRGRCLSKGQTIVNTSETEKPIIKCF